MNHGWNEVGRFRVLARPLPTNEAWTTHWIYLKGQLLGKQLSVPTEGDCEWHLHRQGAYARAEESKQEWKKYGRNVTMVRRGRPTNAERDRRAAMLLAEIPQD